MTSAVWLDSMSRPVRAVYKFGLERGNVNDRRGLNMGRILEEAVGTGVGDAHLGN